MWKVAEAKKTKRLTQEEVKKQLIESIVINDVMETDKLNKKAENQNPEKGIICIAYYQGKVFKELKDREKFITLVNQLKIHKTTVIFKINIFKLCERYPKLLKSSIGFIYLFIYLYLFIFIYISFLKNYYKDIKEVCSENAKEFS